MLAEMSSYFQIFPGCIVKVAWVAKFSSVNVMSLKKTFVDISREDYVVCTLCCRTGNANLARLGDVFTFIRVDLQQQWLSIFSVSCWWIPHPPILYTNHQSRFSVSALSFIRKVCTTAIQTTSLSFWHTGVLVCGNLHAHLTLSTLLSINSKFCSDIYHPFWYLSE